MKKIIKRRVIPTFSHLPDSLHPVTKRVLAGRQVDHVTDLEYSLKNLYPYKTLRGIEQAVHLLYDALVDQSNILIVADYDADGATSCVVATEALRQMGAQHLAYLVPNREKHGYGLTPAIVQLALPYRPDLLITVDNGISSIQGVAAAKQQGIKVLITDHHLPGTVLPAADAIVNPNQPDNEFPSKNLAGVGVIFYLMLALRGFLREQKWFVTHQLPEFNPAMLLDLVALGTVADVVTLDYNNRILVEQGLRRIRANQCCPGIRALLKVANRNQTQVMTNDLSFWIGPCLNSAGRMDDMSYGIACLLSKDDTEAFERAQILDNFNQERKYVEADMQQEAFANLDKSITDLSQLPIGLCLFEKHWHQGVIGILASRIKDRFHRPVIVFTDSGNGEIKGSARSIPGLHIRDALANIATQFPEVLSKFGGHAMAAGLSLNYKDFHVFQQLFDEEVRKNLSDEKLHQIIYSDGALVVSDFNLELAEQLRTISPWGQGFPEPIFDGEFRLIERRRLKEKHLKMQLLPLDGNISLEAIAFNYVDTAWPVEVSQISLAYKLDVNCYRGLSKIQLLVEHVESVF